jgi:hypothetical protein
MIELWGGTTDPAQHDPTNFRYTVHAFSSFRLTRDSNFLKGIGDGSRFIAPTSLAEEFVRSVCRPASEKQDTAISISLIDAQHHRMFGRVGFILNVPVSNVIIAHHTDMGTKDHAASNLWRAFEEYISPTPDEILDKSNPNHVNETVVALAKGEEEVVITGVVVRRLLEAPF